MTDIALLRRELLHRRVAAASMGRLASQDIARRGAAEAPLSHAQERLWFLEQLGLAGGSYNIAVAVRLTGRLDVAALSAALSEVVRRHEALRTRFESRGDGAVQVIDPPWPVALSPQAVEPRQARQRADAIMQQPFDLARDRLLRVALLQLSPDVHVLVLAMHHVVSDGWSMGVLVREVETLYAALAAGRPSPLPALPIQYADYAVWQRRWLADAALTRQLGYWTEQLSGAPAGLELAADRPRPAVPSFRGGLRTFTVDPGRTAALIKLARQEGATLFMALLAAFNVLLARWSGQDDVVVGTPIAGRTRAETEGLIGFFVNMLALRTDLTGAPSFRDVLRRVKAVALEAYAHQDLPFEKLVEALHPIRDLSREPIFQVVFALQNMPQRPTHMAGLSIEPFDSGAVPAKFDLELSVAEVDGGLSASLVYATDLFDDSTIERLVGHFGRILDGIVAEPDRRIRELALLGEAERRQLLADWNGPAALYPQDRCLHELFAEQAARRPDAIAVVLEDQTLSYGELERRANRLAHHLRALGVGPDVVVGLCVERSLDMAVGVLGILKAGGAYLPLDPRYPADRLAYMLADAKVTVLLTQEALADRLPAPAARLVRLDTDWPDIARQPETPPASGVDADHLAYVIYTSGSTGRPKGVMIPHRGIMNLAEAQLAQLPLAPTDRILQFASISFDAAVWDVVMSWRVGAALVLAEPRDLMPGEPLRDLLIRQRITTVLLPPTALAALPAAALPDLTTLIVGGEACSAEMLRPWLSGRSVLNAYGPTEASVCTTMFLCAGDRRPPIGRPLPNARIYVLDQQMEPVPVGVAGELYIGGAGLARGYLLRPGLTAERFVPNPFADGERLYRTGDLVRWRADGELDFLGRLDTQVKLRGFRIELGEIEATLLSDANVAQAVVVAREDAAGKRLVAYVVPRQDAMKDATPDAAFDLGELRRQLQHKLPDYMVPAALVKLDQLPLTPNGKLDRNALPAPDRHREAEHQPPRNPVETVLAGLFAEILGLERVGINENFFELGGDSIQSIQVVSRARAAGVAITPRQIFQYQTVATLAHVAEQPAAATEVDVTSGAAPLTPIQRWFFEQPGPIEHFNQAVLLEVPADIRHARLERALASLLIHHDALRSRFVRRPTGWQQEYLAADEVAPIAVAHFDMAELMPDARIEQMEIAATTLQQSLDPVAGRLVAAAWFDFGADTPGRLLLAIHHLVVDGVSWRILIEDLIAGYGQLERSETVELPGKTTSFKSWATRLQNHAEDVAVSSELDFWTAACHEAPDLPIDHAVDLRHATYGQTEGLTLLLTAEETQALLTAVPQAYHSRINDALLAALSVALAGWRAARGEAETATLVDLEGHGREDLFAAVDLSRTIGWFTTMFPVRLDAGRLDLEQVMAGGPAAGAALRRVKEHLRAVPHGGIGWGLLRYLNEQTAEALRSLPRAKISFNYLGRFDEGPDSGWRLAAESSGLTIAPNRGRDHLIEVVALVKDGTLQIQWRWWPAAHDRASIVDLAECFAAALRGLIRHCATRGISSHTPSDFALAQLDETRLNALQQRYPDLEDIWPLAPMQHVMLSHARRSPDSVAYHEQLCLTLEGDLDRAALEAAWRELTIRHAAMRVAIADDVEEAPLQVVRRDAKLPWRADDWSGLDVQVAERRLQNLLAEDRAQGFDLASGMLLRVCLLRHSRVRHSMILSFHHLLLDGWSIPIMLRELLAFYQSARQRRPAALPSARPYRDYLAWLAAADRTASEAFWRNRLAGLAPHRLDLPAGESEASPDAAGEHRATLSEQLTAQLQALAQAQRLTMNTLIQGAWALALGRHTADDDLIFGMTTAGRPGELPGVERMVGLCINTLPRRVRLDPTARVTDWLVDLQAQQAEEQSHDGCSLIDIRRWSGAPADEALFESVIVFENYPVGPTLADQAAVSATELRVGAIASFEEGVHFPLCLVAAPGARIKLRVIFGRRRFDAAAISQLADDLVSLLTAIAADPGQRLAALWSDIAGAEPPYRTAPIDTIDPPNPVSPP
ncbi:amino acid adenylation domain-containing protein/non-ribosomal peptide synthase protein (TIGR01720 family) [Bradyrhizobium sp. AZCC 1719]|uniref:amino acid adenylation domain-containing protein n=1 Tax=Bradyrhizobium sp. AZCC 1719 TaxID=3117028 RepID=UPI002FF37B78